jgi:proline iminopeptidase
MMMRGALLLCLVGAAVARADVNEFPVRSGDVSLHVRCVGGKAATDVLVVIPGGPGLSYDYLQPLEQLASARLMVVSYDPRGAGRSTKPADGDYSLDAQLADLEAIRTAIGVEKMHLLGHSWGTVPAMDYAFTYPVHLKSLILIGVGGPSNELDREAFQNRFGKRKADLIASGVITGNRPGVQGDDCIGNFNAILPVHFFNPRHPKAKALAGTYHCAIGHETEAAAGDWDFRHQLTELSMPVLLLNGGGDSNFDGTRETAALIPEKLLDDVILPSCGHFPFLECPDPFFDVMEDWLGRTSTPAPASLPAN